MTANNNPLTSGVQVQNNIPDYRGIFREASGKEFEQINEPATNHYQQCKIMGNHHDYTAFNAEGI
jgi:hypothetical protein